MRSGWTWLLLGWLMLAASARAEPEPLRVDVVSSSFVLPGRIARLDALGAPAGVRFQQRVVDPATVLPDGWPAGSDLVLLDTPRPTDVEQVMAVVDGSLQNGKVPWLRVGGGAPASGHLPAEVARRIAGYYGNGGEANIRTLAAYLQAWRSGAGTDRLPQPQVLPATGYSAGGSQWLDNPQALQAQWQRDGQASWPKVAVLVSGSMLSGMQTQVLDALIEAGRARRIALFGVWFDATADDALQQALRGIDVDALVNLTHLQNGTARAAEFSALDVPVLQALNHRQGDADDWRAATTGIPMATLATFVAVPEAWGASDPIVVSANARGEVQPIPEQIDALAAKLQRLAALRHTAAADKRLALLFWNAPDGERNLSASHLNVPRSIEALLPRLAQAGYSTQPVDEKTLIEQLQALLGGYYHPERLDALLDAGLADTLPVADYRRWLSTLPATRRDELRAQWGDPAHHPAVRQRHGQAVFVLPRLRLGNLLLMPQPPRAGRVGEATHDMASVPSHYYLAAYQCLRQQWKADALIHFGTHGTQEWTPGKDRGLWVADYPWLAVGDVPVFYPYIQDNVGEAIQAKRRGRAVVVSHQTPPFAPSGLYDELRDLHAVVHELQQLDQGPVRDATAARLRTLATDSGIAADLGWSAVDMQARFDSFLPVLHDHLHELARRNLPLGLHTFGQPASPEHRLLMVMQQLGPGYLKALGEDPMEATAVDYRQIQQGLGYRTLLHHLREGASISSVANPDLRAALQHAVQLDAALADTQEIESLLLGLGGGFVQPGAGGDPIRTPELRSGRNLFAFEPDRIPTRAAFDTGELALQQLLQAYRDDHGGQLPRKLAISLWSSEAIRHLGVLEAQVLHALGLRPRWDSGGKVIALDIVPDAELQRPRIDVVIQATSVYRDQFDPFLRLLAGAIEQLAAMPASPGNPIAGNALAVQQRLQRAWRLQRQADQVALGVGRGDMGDRGDGGDQCLLEFGLRIFAVADHVEAIRNGVALERLAVAGAAGRIELLQVAVGSLVQVQVHQQVRLALGHPAHQRGGFLDLAAVTEAAVGVDGIRIPALDTLVAPRADARRHDQVQPAQVTLGLLFQELQGTVDAAGLVAMHATGDQRGRQCRVPVVVDHGKQRVMVRRIVQLAVLDHIEAVVQALKGGHHVVVIAALALLAGPPLCAFRVAPGLSGGADRVELRNSHWVLQGSNGWVQPVILSLVAPAGPLPPAPPSSSRGHLVVKSTVFGPSPPDGERSAAGPGWTGVPPPARPSQRRRDAGHQSRPDRSPRPVGGLEPCRGPVRGARRTPARAR